MKNTNAAAQTPSPGRPQRSPIVCTMAPWSGLLAGSTSHNEPPLSFGHRSLEERSVPTSYSHGVDLLIPFAHSRSLEEHSFLSALRSRSKDLLSFAHRSLEERSVPASLFASPRARSWLFIMLSIVSGTAVFACVSVYYLILQKKWRREQRYAALVSEVREETRKRSHDDEESRQRARVAIMEHARKFALMRGLIGDVEAVRRLEVTRDAAFHSRERAHAASGAIAAAREAREQAAALVRERTAVDAVAAASAAREKAVAARELEKAGHATNKLMHASAARLAARQSVERAIDYKQRMAEVHRLTDAWCTTASNNYGDLPA